MTDLHPVPADPPAMPPRGARAEDLDRRGIADTLAMLDDPDDKDAISPVDLFTLAVREDGTAWMTADGRYAAALFGITVTNPVRRLLHVRWMARARDILTAEIAA